MGVKSLLGSAFDKGIKAMQNLKENVQSLGHDAPSLLRLGGKKPPKHKRMSDDFGQ